MRAEDLKGWLAAARRGEKERETNTKDGGDGGVGTGGTIEDGHTPCSSTESCTKTSAAGSKTKRLDLGGNVAAHRRESLHAPGPAVRPGGQAEVGEGDWEEPLKGQEEEDGGSGGRKWRI